MTEGHKILLLKLEQLIGCQCYNTNIRNYRGRWYYTEGRSFRYPLSYPEVRVGQQSGSMQSSTIDEGVLLSGHYLFGANELAIMPGLLSVLQFLEVNYGVSLNQKIIGAQWKLSSLTQSITERRKRLLVKLEGLIGSRCYNANTRNYSGGGYSEGRVFRYPIQYIIKDLSSAKTTATEYSIENSAVLSGHYVFGSNDLAIMMGLHMAISYIESCYGLDVENGEELPKYDQPLAWARWSDVPLLAQQFAKTPGAKVRISGGTFTICGRL